MHIYTYVYTCYACKILGKAEGSFFFYFPVYEEWASLVIIISI